MSEARALLLAIANEMDRRDELMRNCGEHRLAGRVFVAQNPISGVIRTVLKKTDPVPEEGEAPESEPEDPERYHTWPA